MTDQVEEALRDNRKVGDLLDGFLAGREEGSGSGDTGPRGPRPSRSRPPAGAARAVQQAQERADAVAERARALAAQARGEDVPSAGFQRGRRLPAKPEAPRTVAEGFE